MKSAIVKKQTVTRSTYRHEIKLFFLDEETMTVEALKGHIFGNYAPDEAEAMALQENPNAVKAVYVGRAAVKVTCTIENMALFGNWEYIEDDGLSAAE